MREWMANAAAFTTLVALDDRAVERRRVRDRAPASGRTGVASGLTQNWSGCSGSRAEMCPATPGGQPRGAPAGGIRPPAAPCGGGARPSTSSNVGGASRRMVRATESSASLSPRKQPSRSSRPPLLNGTYRIVKSGGMATAGRAIATGSRGRSRPEPPAWPPAQRTTKRGGARRRLDEIAEHGIAGMTIESVAARAGVSKVTIYRRWPDKVALALAALESLPGACRARHRQPHRRPA